MNALEADRLTLLHTLLDFSAPLRDSLRRLDAQGWDYAGAAATLRKEHIGAVLTRYRAGQLGEPDVEAWANAIEGRDDIDFDVRDERVIGELIFELANPLLTETLTRTRAAQLFARLSFPTAHRRP